MRKVRLHVSDRVVRFLDVEWAEGEPDFMCLPMWRSFLARRSPSILAKEGLMRANHQLVI